ncbi:hypothetical protein Tco_0447129, partial [Tanacetum coccineum]
HIETENAQDEGRTREMVDEDKEIYKNILSTEDVLSTDKEVVSTDKEKVLKSTLKVLKSTLKVMKSKLKVLIGKEKVLKIILKKEVLLKPLKHLLLQCLEMMKQ